MGEFKFSSLLYENSDVLIKQNVSVLTAAKCEKYERVQEKEFEDVENHSSEGDLKRPQMMIDAEHIDELQETAHQTMILLNHDRAGNVFPYNKKLKLTHLTKIQIFENAVTHFVEYNYIITMEP